MKTGIKVFGYCPKCKFNYVFIESKFKRKYKGNLVYRCTKCKTTFQEEELGWRLQNIIRRFVRKGIIHFCWNWKEWYDVRSDQHPKRKFDRPPRESLRGASKRLQEQFGSPDRQTKPKKLRRSLPTGQKRTRRSSP